jgi:hypothetical protein
MTVVLREIIVCLVQFETNLPDFYSIIVKFALY